MTENPDIPSAQLKVGTLSLVIVSSIILSVFLLPFFSNATATVDSAQEQTWSSIVNAQTINLFKPTTFNNANALGGASFAVVDDALIGTRSVLDDQLEEAFLDQTGHTNNVYIVRQGDTISQIAASFGVSQNTILWANKLSSAKKIRVGQELVILPISGVLHTVTKGETLASIAKKFEGDVDEIVSFNKISKSAPLPIGTELTIPGGKIKSTKTSSSIASSRPTGSAIRTVRSPSGLLEVPNRITYTWNNGVKTSQLRGTGGPSYSNYYIRPINGYRKSRGLHGYNSVDFAAPQGTPILASASGKVIIAKSGGWNGGYGKYVAIEHGNGTQTLYAHQSSVIVSQGQSVVQGQVIGYVGTSGNSSGNHLHFEVRGAKNPF